MKTRTNFENLRVYKLSEEFSHVIWSIVIRWESFARDTLGRQLIRAVDSIVPNS